MFKFEPSKALAENEVLSKTESLKSIMKKRLRVPFYQRPYSWAKKEWEDVMIDIRNICNGETPFVLLGTIVTLPKDGGYILIDGQQRITTMFIVYAAIKKIILNKIDLPSSVSFSNKWLNGDKNDSFGDYKQNLKLHDEHNDFFQNYILEDLSEGFKVEKDKKVITDDVKKHLYEAYMFFYEELSTFLDEQSQTGEVSKEEILQFIKILDDYMIFINIVSKDEEYANTAFENLNYRGKKLTPLELLEN